MRIGIIGSGNMGRALGVRFAQLGHSVFFGARRLDVAQAAAAVALNGAQYGDNDEAAAFGDVLIWTMRESNPAKVLAIPLALVGKVVLDVNNRDYAKEARSGASFRVAIAEALQAKAPQAKVVKAFNAIAMESFDTPPKSLAAVGAQTFIAGGDAEAKAAATQLAADLGFAAIDLGDGPAAFRAAEAMGDIIRLLMIDGGRGGSAHLVMIKLPPPSLGSIGTREASSYN